MATCEAAYNGLPMRQDKFGEPSNVAVASLCLHVMVSARMALGMLEARVHWITGGDLIQSGNTLGLPHVFTRTHVWRWEVGRCICDASVFNAHMHRN